MKEQSFCGIEIEMLTCMLLAMIGQPHITIQLQTLVLN